MRHLEQQPSLSLTLPPSLPPSPPGTLKNINMGSLIVLILLRLITSNLNRLHDEYLLSNTLAVLLNLKPHVRDMHPYAAIRTVQVMVDTMKRFASAKDDERGPYEETCGVILNFVNSCLNERMIEGNIHLVYSLLHRSIDWAEVTPTANFEKFPTKRISSVLEYIESELSSVLDDGNMSAEDVQSLLLSHVAALKSASRATRSVAEGGGLPTEGMAKQPDDVDDEDVDVVYNYEEEEDPEVFFVPYAWEIVCEGVAGNIMKWDFDHIAIFDVERNCDPAAELDDNDEKGQIQETSSGGGVLEVPSGSSDASTLSAMNDAQARGLLADKEARSCDEIL